MKNLKYDSIIEHNPPNQKQLEISTSLLLADFSPPTSGKHDKHTKEFVKSVLEPISKAFSLKLSVDVGKRLGGTYPDLWQSNLGSDKDVHNVNNRNIDNVYSDDPNYDPTISVIIIIIFFSNELKLFY